jgi:hypothetical protein
MEIDMAKTLTEEELGALYGQPEPVPLNKYLAKLVMEYAVDNYDKDGWDFLVETYTLEEVEAVLAMPKSALGAGQVRTLKGAIKKVKSKCCLKLLDERRKDCY